MNRRGALAAVVVVATALVVISATTGVVRFGQYNLRVTSLLNCASARGRPYTSILISQDGVGWRMLPDVLLDSGADLSFFPAWLAEALGIDLSQCEQGTTRGVGGTSVVYYTDVYLSLVLMGGIEPDLDGYILGTDGEPLIIKARVAFSEDEANANTFLLGRRDVFSAISLTFRGDRATVTPASVTPGPPTPTPPSPTPTAPSGMVLIPAGSFRMGNSFGEGDSDERPVHTVYVSAFFVDIYEATKALWDEVASWAQANGYDIGPEDGRGKAPNHPVYDVSWYEAVKWCNARSEKEGQTPAYYTSSAKTTVYRTGQVDVQTDWVRWDTGYRLPTEAEWEKAARGGCEGRRFPWCDTDTIQHSRANYLSASYYDYDTSANQGFHPKYTTGFSPHTSPVGSFAPNGYGLYDMAGNVFEWLWDWYGSDYYTRSPGNDPRGPSRGTYRVIRGGCWNYRAHGCRVASRTTPGPYFTNYLLGFRLVLPPGP